MPSRRRVARLLPWIAASSLLAALPASVAAHAEVVRAIPADGETVREPVTVVSARYTEDLVGDSQLEIEAADGATVATGDIDPEDDRRMVVRPESPLRDGTYTVKSTAFSLDGHKELAQWTFTVEVPETPAPSPSSTADTSSTPEGSAGASPSAEPSASPKPTASPSPGSPTSGTGDVLLPIIAGLAIVAIGAGFLLNRGRSRPA